MSPIACQPVVQSRISDLRPITTDPRVHRYPRRPSPGEPPCSIGSTGEGRRRVPAIACIQLPAVFPSGEQGQENSLATQHRHDHVLSAIFESKACGTEIIVKNLFYQSLIAPCFASEVRGQVSYCTAGVLPTPKPDSRPFAKTNRTSEQLLQAG